MTKMTKDQRAVFIEDALETQLAPLVKDVPEVWKIVAEYLVYGYCHPDYAMARTKAEQVAAAEAETEEWIREHRVQTRKERDEVVHGSGIYQATGVLSAATQEKIRLVKKCLDIGHNFRKTCCELDIEDIWEECREIKKR